MADSEESDALRGSDIIAPRNLRLKRPTTRKMLRAFQDVRSKCPDPGFMLDLEYLEHKDLDLSIRLGGMLAFNALLITVGTHPVSASPGAPLSLDAATQPLETIASLLGVAAFALSSLWVLGGLLIGEEFDCTDISGDALRQRLFAAYIRSVDGQMLALSRAVRATVAGGVITLLVWAWILAGKFF